MNTLMVLLEWGSTVGLSALAASGCRAWNRERTHGKGALALAFLMLALTSLISRVVDALGRPPTFLAPLTIGAFELSGLFLLFFRGSFLPLRKPVRSVAVAAVTITVAGVALFGLPTPGVTPNPAQSVTLAMLVFAWTGCVGEPMVRFWRASQGRPAVQRTRLRALATGYGAILLVLFMAAAPQSIASTRPVQVLSALLGVAVVPLLYAGFDPPRWLRRLWCHAEEAQARRGVQELLAFAEDARLLAARALEWATRLVGAEAGLIAADPGGVLATQGLRDAESLDLLAQAAGRRTSEVVRLSVPLAGSAVVVPLHSSVVQATMVVQSGPFTPLFGSDEVARLEEYAVSVGVALERVLMSTRYRSFLQAVSDMGEGLVITENGRPVYVNDAYSALTGYSVAELMALPSLLDLAPEESRAELAARLAARIAGGDVPYQYEAELVRKDGRRVTVENAVRLFEGTGHTTIIAIVRDISERAAAQQALRDSESKLQSIIDNSLSAVITMDRRGAITGWSARAESAFGWRRDAVLGRSLAETILPGENGAWPRLAGVGDVTAVHRDGREIPVELAVSPAIRSGDDVFVVAFARDISDRKNAETLRSMQFAVTRVLSDSLSLDEAAPSLLRIMATALGCQTATLWLVDGGERLDPHHGWSAESVEVRPPVAIGRVAVEPAGDGLARRAWLGGAPLAGDFRTRDRDGGDAAARTSEELRDALAFPIWVDREVVGVVQFQSTLVPRLDADVLDIVTDLGRQIGQFLERRRAEAALHESLAQLAEVAATDPLCGVRNRREFERQLSTIPRRRFSVLAIDVDNLKETNDRFGHETGDVLLRGVALTLTSLVRGWDVLARVGGDEFAVLLIDADAVDAAKTGERLRSAVHAIAVPDGRASISVGWASGPAGADPHAIWRQADSDLYRAKRHGRDRVAGADTSDPEVFAPSGWADRVEQVLTSRELTVMYQPIARLEDGVVVGHEALARPPECGPIDSVEGFFAEAQRMGRTRDIDWLCRRRAIEDAAWPAPTGWSLFINVRMVTLLDPVHGVDQLLLVLRAAGARPEQVVLELTEHELAPDLDRLRLVLAAYREHGIRFAIDDVGEGHSTLELLAAANAEYIKLARSLTTTAARPGSRSAIHAAVAFAASSGATVLAEGLESDFAVRQMLDFGVTLGQGWWLGRPAPLALPFSVAALAEG